MRPRLDKHTLVIELALVYSHCLADKTGVRGPSRIDALETRGTHMKFTPGRVTGGEGANVHGGSGSSTARTSGFGSRHCGGIDEG